MVLQLLCAVYCDVKVFYQRRVLPFSFEAGNVLVKQGQSVVIPFNMIEHIDPGGLVLLRILICKFQNAVCNLPVSRAERMDAAEDFPQDKFICRNNVSGPANYNLFID